MERIEREKRGLVPLTERELLVHGGSKLKKLLDLLDEIVTIIEKVEKYWPHFVEGFQEGWEKA